MNVCGLYCENPWYYRVCEDYNGVVSKVLGDGWLNPQILSVQSLEAHQQARPPPWLHAWMQTKYGKTGPQERYVRILASEDKG